MHRLRNSSGAIRRYRSRSNAFMCVRNGRAAAPAVHRLQHRRLDLEETARGQTGAQRRITVARWRTVRRASSRTMRST